VKDIRLDVYITPEMYLALRHVCAAADRNMSQHVRHLIRKDLETSIARLRADDCGSEGGTAGEVNWSGDE